MDKLPEYPETPVVSIKAFERCDEMPKEAVSYSANSKTHDPLGIQVGGNHYKDCTMQPIEFIKANELGFLEGCVIKRVTRHKHSTGKGRQDIEKAIHELQLILKFDYS